MIEYHYRSNNSQERANALAASTNKLLLPEALMNEFLHAGDYRFFEELQRQRRGRLLGESDDDDSDIDEKSLSSDWGADYDDILDMSESEIIEEVRALKAQAKAEKKREQNGDQTKQYPILIQYFPFFFPIFPDMVRFHFPLIVYKKS